MIDSDNWAYQLNSRKKEFELCERLKKKLRPTPYSWQADKRTIYFFHTEQQRDKFIENNHK